MSVHQLEGEPEGGISESVLHSCKGSLGFWHPDKAPVTLEGSSQQVVKWLENTRTSRDKAMVEVD